MFSHILTEGKGLHNLDFSSEKCRRLWKINLKHYFLINLICPILWQYILHNLLMQWGLLFPFSGAHSQIFAKNLWLFMEIFKVRNYWNRMKHPLRQIFLSFSVKKWSFYWQKHLAWKEHLENWIIWQKIWDFHKQKHFSCFSFLKFNSLEILLWK